jgi:hypothetical protein
MKIKTMRAAARLSRRDWLRDAAAAIGGALVLGATGERANAVVKLSQKVVAYQDHPDGEKRCDRCIHFQPPNACNIVGGDVKPDGYCRFFGVRGR